MRWILCPLVVATLLVRAAHADADADVHAYLMELADDVGAGPWMQSHRLSASGWIEGSFTWNPESQDDVPRLFDEPANSFLMNQLYLAAERSLPEGAAGGWGGKVALLYGTDARSVHERGLGDNQTGEYQFDLLECFLNGRIPVGRGITLKAGKCDTPFGAEVIEAPPNPLFSHSYSFYFGIPFTHTGFFATWTASEKVDLTYGALLGWDVFDDPNDSISQYFGVTVRGADSADSLTVQGIVGPEQPGNDTDLRGVFDATWRHGWTGNLSTTVDAIYGFEEFPGPDASWYGVTAYVTRRFGERFAATFRAEWFHDDGGTRIGFDTDLYSITFGIDARPFRRFANLRLRPEIRWDHAAGDQPFDGGTSADQFTAAIDVIVTF